MEAKVTPFEIGFLAMVVTAFATFGLTLAYVSQTTKMK